MSMFNHPIIIFWYLIPLKISAALIFSFFNKCFPINRTFKAKPKNDYKCRGCDRLMTKTENKCIPFPAKHAYNTIKK